MFKSQKWCGRRIAAVLFALFFRSCRLFAPTLCVVIINVLAVLCEYHVLYKSAICASLHHKHSQTVIQCTRLWEHFLLFLYVIQSLIGSKVTHLSHSDRCWQCHTSVIYTPNVIENCLNKKFWFSLSVMWCEEVGFCKCNELCFLWHHIE